MALPETEDAIAREVRRSRLLTLPALVVLFLAASGPLLVVLLYSFLTAGDYGGVKWAFSTEGWVSVILERDIFDGTLGWADAHLSIFWRSLSLSLITTVVTLIIGLPTAWFIATRPDGKREFWLFLITVPLAFVLMTGRVLQNWFDDLRKYRTGEPMIVQAVIGGDV